MGTDFISHRTSIPAAINLFHAVEYAAPKQRANPFNTPLDRLVFAQPNASFEGEFSNLGERDKLENDVWQNADWFIEISQFDWLITTPQIINRKKLQNVCPAVTYRC
ncbi:MAG: hypothetical protein AAFN77_23235 [Planctomycetota bacterium]